MAEFQRSEEAQAFQQIKDTQALDFLMQRLRESQASARSRQRPATVSWAGELAYDAGRESLAAELLRWIEGCLNRQSK